MTDPVFIELKSVSKSFTGKGEPLVVLDNIDLDIQPNSFVSLVGHSGCGKSTLLRIISGLETATGTLRIGGKSSEDYARSNPIGFVFQDAALLPWKSLLDNVRLPLDILDHDKTDARERLARQAIDLVRLSGFETHFPDHLSGGMRQRASIARSLVYRPQLLLMDEPFGALDDFTRRELSDELLRIWSENNCTVLFVTHSLPEAVLLSDKVVVLDSKPGRIHQIVDIDLPRPRAAAVRNSPEFAAHLRHLEDLIFGAPSHDHR